VNFVTETNILLPHPLTSNLLCHLFLTAMLQAGYFCLASASMHGIFCSPAHISLSAILNVWSHWSSRYNWSQGKM